jgi:uncharacterized membrane protein (UPF0182 family)
MKSQFAQQLTLIDQAGSRVTFGDEQLLPIGNNLVYVRTWYVQSTGPTAVPVLRQVTVTYGQSSYLGASLEDALRQAFGVSLDLGTVVGGGNIAPPPGSDDGGATTTTTAPSTSTTGPAPSTTAAPGSPNVEQLLSQAQQAYDDAQTALKNGDLGTYQTKINQAYNLAAQAATIATGSTTTAVPPTAAATTTTTTANA